VLNNNTASAGIGIQIQPNTSTNGGDNAEFFEDMVVSGWAIGMVIGPTNVGSGPGGVFISHSDFESNTTCGIDIESSGGVNISDNYFESSGASDPTDICIGTGGGVGLPQGIQIIGNHLTSGALTAPYIRAANFYGLLVSNNQIAGSNNKTIISSGGGTYQLGGIYMGNICNHTPNVEITNTAGWETIQGCIHPGVVSGADPFNVLTLGVGVSGNDECYTIAGTGAASLASLPAHKGASTCVKDFSGTLPATCGSGGGSTYAIALYNGSAWTCH
jgi:hypothetical protein